MLEQQYKQLQAQFHPDRFVGADDKQRLQALQQTSLVNDAYNTLKSPLKRAAYLLKLKGVDPEEHNQAHLGEAFLVRQMTLREDLEVLIGEEDMDGLDAMKAAVNKDKQETLEQFVTRYENNDLGEAKATYNKLQFLFKLLDEIEAAEEKILDY